MTVEFKEEDVLLAESWPDVELSQEDLPKEEEVLKVPSSE